MSAAVSVPVGAPARAPQPPVPAPRWRRGHWAALVGIALLQALVRAEVPLGQDAYWGARYGLQVIRTGTLPRSDTYSWTAHGQQWIPNSWAWNVVLGAFYDAFGIIGFWLLGAAVSVASAVVVGFVARRVGARPLPTLAVYAPIGMLGLEAIPRAQTLSNVAALLVALLAVPAVMRRGRVALAPVVLLCAVQVVWMNLHSMALLGPVITGAAGAAALLAARRRPVWPALGRLVAVTALTALCCLLTPYGLLPITHAADVRNASVGLVTEWAPAGFGSTSQVLTLAAVIAGVGLAWRAWRGGRVALAACSVVLAVATLSAIRFLPMLVVAAAPEVALVVGGLKVRETFMKLVVVVVAAVLAALGALGWRDLRTLEPLVSPKLVAGLPTGCRLLNDDLVGDAVILTRPDVAVAIDGRNDMYGRARIETLLREFDNRPGTLARLDAAHVTCVLGPSSSALLRQLRHTAGWSVTATDAVRTLAVREGTS